MKYVISIIVAGIILVSCGPKNAHPTIPPNSRLCSTDWDCDIDTEYCGFVPGYDAAVCRYR